MRTATAILKECFDVASDALYYHLDDNGKHARLAIQKLRVLLAESVGDPASALRQQHDESVIQATSQHSARSSGLYMSPDAVRAAQCSPEFLDALLQAGAREELVEALSTTEVPAASLLERLEARLRWVTLDRILAFSWGVSFMTLVHLFAIVAHAHHWIH